MCLSYLTFFTDYEFMQESSKKTAFHWRITFIIQSSPRTLQSPKTLPVFLVKICLSVDGYLWRRWPVCWIINNSLIHLRPNLHGLLWRRTQRSSAQKIPRDL